MVARVRILQISIAAVNFVIFALAFTSIWPFPNGDFKVDLPSSNEIEWTYDAGVVHVSAPFSIDNGGFYDVDDLLLTYDVTNYSNALLASGRIHIGTIPAGRVTSDTIQFDVPILQLYQQGFGWMVFNDDMLNFVVGVSCKYTMKLVDFEARYNVSVPWDALIQQAAIDSISQSGNQLTVNYHISTSSIFSGTTTLRAYLYSGSTLLAQDSDVIQLGTYFPGSMTFTLGSALPDRVVFQAQILDFPFSQSISITPGMIT